MRLLVVSLILGAIHLFVGMGVQAYMDIKDGRPLDALFDIGLWYLLLIGIVLFAFGGKLGAGAVGIGKIMAIVGAVGILLTGGIAGSILLIVVFAFGTVFNIAINALGAFVHSCRLQYVEFFGKFYTGGGRPFAPFERKTKYIKILKEGNDNVK